MASFETLPYPYPLDGDIVDIAIALHESSKVLDPPYSTEEALAYAFGLLNAKNAVESGFVAGAGHLETSVRFRYWIGIPPAEGYGIDDTCSELQE